MLKPYALFGGDDYYPSGGWGDFRSFHESFDEAVQAGEAFINSERYRNDWYQIVDLTTGYMLAHADKDRSKF